MYRSYNIEFWWKNYALCRQKRVECKLAGFSRSGSLSRSSSSSSESFSFSEI
jgi:hypothetical protein